MLSVKRRAQLSTKQRARLSIAEMYADLLEPMPKNSLEAMLLDARRLRRDWENIGADLWSAIPAEAIAHVSKKRA